MKTTVMNGYTDAIANLPQEAILGSLCFFTISNADVELEGARQELSSLGLSTDLLRKNLRPVDAFSKASRDCGRKFKTVDEVRSELLVRRLGDDQRLILERAMFKAGKKKQLVYEKVAELAFNRGRREKGAYIDHGVTAVRTTDHLTFALTEEEDNWLTLALATFADQYDHYLTHLDSHAVRTFVREYIDSLSGVCVKESGGLYFVTHKHADQVAKLATWVKSVGSEFHYLPLLNLADQREMIAEAFEEEAVREIEHLMVEVSEILNDSSRVIRQETWDSYATKAALLTKKMNEYNQVLDTRSQRAALEIKTYTRQIMQLGSRISGGSQAQAG